ncbi:hypothetical protein BpHYR1_053612 [Brachionus plicatilis]|uniref:Uncharacterized protein n=1 Tax=Brachionus plicatilis TaxID=10195 RepID=A0A3M7PHB6_BRAPC|nr:hypothetical protein BpHYR1_053612 [Brachionus plicatilis]
MCIGSLLYGGSMGGMLRNFWYLLKQSKIDSNHRLSTTRISSSSPTGIMPCRVVTSSALGKKIGKCEQLFTKKCDHEYQNKKTLNGETALSKHANPVPCDLCGELMKNIKG